MLHSHVGPTCRGLNGQCIRTPWSIKGGRPLEENSGWKKAKARQRTDTRHTSSLELSRGKAIQHIVDVGYYAPAARTTQNLVVFIVFLSEIELRLANPRVHTLWARASAFRHPAVVCSTTTFIILDVLHLCCLFYFKIRGPFTKRTTEPNLLFKIFLLVICDYRIT